MRWYGLVLLSLLLLVTASGCKKKPPLAAPPPPPAPPSPTAPTATLRATPSVIDQGQSSTLSWNSSNATELTIDPSLGAVAPQGSTSVQPDRSTTYTLVAKGPGGSAEASARVTVNAPTAAPAPVRQMPMEQAFANRVRDAYFDYDKSEIRPDARVALTQTAEFMRQYTEARVLVEGHCDERGSTEYNLSLGDRRAAAVKDYLTSLGIDARRIQTVSYGKERPFCFESTEECWQTNRRGHFVLLP
ncbi:MAG: peptidoglycan-associated lipoprotein Pal [Candidatus Acidiferrales bacterium]